MIGRESKRKRIEGNTKNVRKEVLAVSSCRISPANRNEENVH